ncbi:MAG: hypothetical protein RL095_1326 [Verrucomicrobiota bacterium]|jgi:hypothetical protein
MNRREAARLLLLLPAFAPMIRAADDAAPAITGFKVLDVSDPSASIRADDKSPYGKVETGKFYPFPASIKTVRAQMTIEFSAGNKVRILPQTMISLSSPNIKHPKVKVVGGTVALELDSFPKDHSLTVDTPSAVCGHVGTHFEVSVGDPAGKIEGAQAFKCSKGEIYVNPSGFKISKLGAGAEVATSDHEGKENSYCDARINVPKGSGFKIKMSDDGKEFVGAAASGFKIAHNRKNNLHVASFSDQNLKTENGAPIAELGKALVLDGDEFKENANAQPYLEAAQTEGQLHTQLIALTAKLAEAAPADLAALQAQKLALEKQRDQAADKATDLAKKLARTRKNVQKAIQGARRR